MRAAPPDGRRRRQRGRTRYGRGVDERHRIRNGPRWRGRRRSWRQRHVGRGGRHGTWRHDRIRRNDRAGYDGIRRNDRTGRDHRIRRDRRFWGRRLVRSRRCRTGWIRWRGWRRKGWSGRSCRTMQCRNRATLYVGGHGQRFRFMGRRARSSVPPLEPSRRRGLHEHFGPLRGILPVRPGMQGVVLGRDHRCTWTSSEVLRHRFAHDAHQLLVQLRQWPGPRLCRRARRWMRRGGGDSSLDRAPHHVADRYRFLVIGEHERGRRGAGGSRLSLVDLARQGGASARMLAPARVPKKRY